MNLNIVSILNDNYVWILNQSDQSCVIIDPGDFLPVFKKIIQLNLKPKAILITHHHIDHVAGINELIFCFPKIKVYGPIESIKFGINNVLFGGEKIYLLDKIFHVIYTPGHTIGHLSYYINPYLFCGDTLFSGGCGNIYKKNYMMMFLSLKKFSILPNKTIICPAHEYTKKNLEFSKKLFPNEKNIIEYYNLINKIKYKKITLPSTIGLEKKINVFLHLSRIKNKKLEKKSYDNFILIRTIKNNYK
ncbi:Hydroxyacylglutathione hydrolase GloB [Buchnera aphidicola (Eriosoma grossulariae)]